MKISQTILSLFIFSLMVNCTRVESQPKKSKFLDTQTHTKKAGKVRSSLMIELKDVSQNEQTLDLQATIHANMFMKSATVEWQVPKTTSVVAGHSSNTLDLTPGDPLEIQISLDRQNLKNNDQIFLFVYVLRDGERLGGTNSFVYMEKSDTSKGAKQKLKKMPRIFE